MKWLFQDFDQRARFALGLYTLKSFYRERTLADEGFLNTITNVALSRICGFIEEPIQNEFFLAGLESVRAELRKLEIYSAELYAQTILLHGCSGNDRASL